MAKEFCRKYVEDVFSKWDTDNSNVLNKQQLKKWATHEQKQSGVWKSKIKKEFFEMVLKADQNGDGKLDKWELYEFCVSNYIAKEEM